MTSHRGFYGLGIYKPKHECNCGTLWRSAYSFGANFLFTVGPRFRQQASDTTKAWRDLPMFHFQSFDEMVSHLPYSCPLVGVELAENACSLNKFVHPERAVYLLGAEDHGLPSKILERCHHVVQIPGLNHCLNVAVAGSIVLYDRMIGQQKRSFFCEKHLHRIKKVAK